MLMIRFQRIGRKNDAAFRIAVLPKQSGPKAGKYVDLVGNYNPKTKAVNLNADRIKEWMAKGAQVSPTVHNLLLKQGVITGKKINVLPKKTAPVKEVPAEEAAPAPAPAAEATDAPAEEAPVVEETTEEAAPAEAPTEEAAPEVAPETATETPTEEPAAEAA